MRRIFQILLPGSFLFVLGCPPPPGPVPEPLTRHDALELYNANVQAIQPFRAGIAEWEMEFVDPDGKKQHFQELFGKIFYRPPVQAQIPAKFYLEASAPLQKGWVVGSNEDEYWMYSQWAQFGRWGKYQHYGKDCAASVPVHPQVFLEFTGLLPLPYEPPYPLYKVRAETYIIEYIVLKNEGYSSKREIIVDRRTDLPREINAYNADGLMILHSELKKYQPLAEAMLPTQIHISFPKENSFLRLKLTGYKPDDKSRDKLFIRPKTIPGIEDYRQIDKDCEHD
jgi:hypothetical protein